MTYRYPVDFTEPDHINPASQSGNMDVKIFPLTGRRVWLKTKVSVGIKNAAILFQNLMRQMP
ncbi:hypothetical protein GO156_004969 [Salmonella enterica subsp. enterica serovar Kentucky]|uniref:Uncharacterized protein n=1 Tax=Escherichia coli TaxID=562 RepID=A0A228U4X5_ECOLX|nr:hypothetical protein [Salmonella enterica subsp. enterica serovar Kentucky]EAC1963257.1 hypothetical protein [Escherichia coli]EAZ3200116.1 hypothetical protein [Salmonella enterica]EBG3522969.1 hypothetical protein [Salmonella enterica subsp. enterica]ECF3035480.1 hypothetical protein [Salmonella enterica subsp. enterica serovar Brancaster]ECQ1656374.1 hypothetical protein [Salmonella enterica subsp. enterica serovar Agona]ECS7931759.1 hypothetical protein [Salmonella enterica subsp. ente